MFVKSETRIRVSKDNKKRPHKIYVLGCDQCLIVFESRSKNRSLLKRHYCSKECVHQSLKIGGQANVAMRLTCFQQYGHNTVSKVDSVQELRRKRSFEKWGTNNPMQVPANQNKRKLTCIKKYGVATMFAHHDFPKIRISSMKRNGTSFNESKDERNLINWFRMTWNDVRRHEICDRWNIDAYISDVDVYVQLDGVYWHGLNMSYDDIINNKSSHSKFIAYAKKNDFSQNLWFAENKKKLLRIKDIDFKQLNVTEAPTLERLKSAAYIKIGFV